MNINELQQELDNAKQVKKPQTMKELYQLLQSLGETWRDEHKEEKEITKGKRKGEVETKIPRPSVAEVANILLRNCYFTFIGYSKLTDSSQLYIYHLDLGYYIASRDIVNKLILKFDSRLTSKRFTEEVIIFLRTETKIKPPMQESYLIPVRNGIFNLHTKQLEPFNPKHIITTKITTAYNPEAKKPVLGGWFDFDKWLGTLACDDKEIITLLWQVMNEAINPNRTRKKMVILTGDGNNGKGTFQALLENLMVRKTLATLNQTNFKNSTYFQPLMEKFVILVMIFLINTWTVFPT